MWVSGSAKMLTTKKLAPTSRQQQSIISLAHFDFPQTSQKQKGKNAIRAQFHVALEIFVNTSRPSTLLGDLHYTFDKNL